jgi:four helix bundle protein
VQFDHERLDVYQLALQWLARADRIVMDLPRGRAYFADQLTRASASIVLNIAEGSGKFSKADKRRYYLSALGSATECAAICDVMAQLGLITDDRQGEAKRLLVRITSMLIKLVKAQE